MSKSPAKPETISLMQLAEIEEVELRLNKVKDLMRLVIGNAGMFQEAFDEKDMCTVAHSATELLELAMASLNRIQCIRPEEVA